MRVWLIILAAVTVFWSNTAHARRMAPKDVPPVVAGGIRYQVSHFGVTDDKKQNGGFVQAWDIRKKKLLWDRMVYRIHYDGTRETDVQDVFITRIRVKGTKLLVTNERHEQFEMDLPSGSVRALTEVGPGRSVATENAPGVPIDAAKPGEGTPGRARQPQ